MTQDEFNSLIAQSQHASSDDYRAGYQRGLRRHFHGEAFGTAEEHEQWLRLEDHGDPGRRARREGYAAGFAGQRPAP